jgi:hypothetical protein
MIADMGMTPYDGTQNHWQEPDAGMTTQHMIDFAQSGSGYDYSLALHAGDIVYSTGYALKWNLFNSRLDGLADVRWCMRALFSSTPARGQHSLLCACASSGTPLNHPPPPCPPPCSLSTACPVPPRPGQPRYAQEVAPPLQPRARSGASSTTSFSAPSFHHVPFLPFPHPRASAQSATGLARAALSLPTLAASAASRRRRASPRRRSRRTCRTRGIGASSTARRPSS